MLLKTLLFPIYTQRYCGTEYLVARALTCVSLLSFLCGQCLPRNTAQLETASLWLHPSKAPNSLAPGRAGQSFKPLCFSFKRLLCYEPYKVTRVMWAMGWALAEGGKKWSKAQWKASALPWRSFTSMLRTFIQTKAKHEFVFSSIVFKLN